MSAKHAVLGLVIERPGYGYDLTQRLGDRFGQWRWEPTGVYRALDSLARDEYVQTRKQKGSGNTGRAAPRLIYEATPRGWDHFRSWMAAPSVPSPTRQELDLKLLFAEPELLPALLEQIRSQEQCCVDELGALLATTEPARQGSPPALRLVVRRLQTDAEILALEARIKWLRIAHATLAPQMMAETANPQRKPHI